MAKFKSYVVGDVVEPFNPEPPKPETRHVTHGPVDIGVEYRVLDRPEEGVEVDTRGVTIHVSDRREAIEYLRFDCFGEDPHYHYFERGVVNRIVAFDPHAFGNVTEWALIALRDHLPEMLRRSYAPDWIEELPLVTPRSVMDEIAALVGEALGTSGSRWGQYGAVGRVAVPGTLPEAGESSMDAESLGQAMRSHVFGHAGTHGDRGPVDLLAPDLGPLLDETLWGTIWAREELPLEVKSLCTISVLLALHHYPEARAHMAGAKNLGITIQELSAAIVHLVFYAGLPVVYRGLELAADCYGIEG